MIIIRYSTICVFLLFVLLSCGRVTEKFCGELSVEQKAILDSLDKSHGDYLRFEPIPCEYSYLYVHLKTDEINDDILIETQLALIKSPEGWEILDVVGPQGEFLFRQHINNGKVSRIYKDGKLKTIE